MPTENETRTPPVHQPRRQEYACDDAWIRNFLSQEVVGHVATVWEDQPFITPVNYWYDAQAHAIYFHTNLHGRLVSNVKQNDKVCFEASCWGKLLPSNIAMEFGIQYESVVAYGHIRLLEDESEKQRILHAMIAHYFPDMQPGKHYRPATEGELRRTAVFMIPIEYWSGKRNWSEHARQSGDWPSLGNT